MVVSAAEYQYHHHTHSWVGCLCAYSQAEINDWCVKVAGPAYVHIVKLESTTHSNNNNGNNINNNDNLPLSSS